MRLKNNSLINPILESVYSKHICTYTIVLLLAFESIIISCAICIVTLTNDLFVVKVRFQYTTRGIIIS